MIHLPGAPRSAMEMLFVLEALPCPKCGTHAGGEYTYRGGTSSRGGQECVLVSPCPKCRAVRELHFHEARDISKTPAEYQLGGPEPSTVFDPGQLMAEHDRVSQLVADIPPADPDPGIDAITRAMTAVVEIGKFIPNGSDEVPASAFWTDAGKHDRTLRPTRYRRSWLEAEKKKYAALEARYFKAAAGKPAPQAASAATGGLDQAALAAHLAWVKRGGKGAGRISLRGVRAPNGKLGPAELTGAMLAECVLDGIDVSYGTLDRAQLDRVSWKGGGLASTSFAGARLTGCNFEGAGMVLAKLGDTVVDGGTFARAELDRTTWYRADVKKADFRAARFGNAALDKAVFADCDLRGAALALLQKQPLGTTLQARFERCDLRDTTWAGRDLDGARFVDCKLDGARGKPGSIKGVVIERAEIGGRRLAGAAALAALGWT